MAPSVADIAVTLQPYHGDRQSVTFRHTIRARLRYLPATRCAAPHLRRKAVVTLATGSYLFLHYAALLMDPVLF